MIELNMQGRLGNQMFQYAFVRALQEKKNGEPINLCFSGMSGVDGFVNSLQDFNVEHFYTYDKIHPSFIQRIIIYTFVIIRKMRHIGFHNRMAEHIFEIKYQKILNFFGIYWLTQGYYDFPIKNKKNTILIGYFESAKYFESIKELIKNEFTPKKERLVSNSDLYKQIESTESVCITIRRGDFVTNENVKNGVFVCKENYFYKGVEVIKNKINNPVFFIFSDDIEWVRENMNFGIDIKIYYEKGNDPIWEKLRLMYSCKHFVISNSTFSWWAQYLSRNENKTVIAPNRWRNYECVLGIYETNWILIEP